MINALTEARLGLSSRKKWGKVLESFTELKGTRTKVEKFSTLLGYKNEK